MLWAILLLQVMRSTQLKQSAVKGIEMFEFFFKKKVQAIKKTKYQLTSVDTICIEQVPLCQINTNSYRAHPNPGRNTKTRDLLRVESSR